MSIILFFLKLESKIGYVAIIIRITCREGD